MSEDPTCSSRRPPRHPFEPGNGWVTPAEKLLVTCLVVLCAAFIGFAAWTSYRMENTNSRIETTQEDIAQNRALGCRILISLGQPVERGVCYDPSVTRYYDPETAPTPTRTTGLVCQIAREVGIPARDLPATCGEVDGGG